MVIFGVHVDLPNGNSLPKFGACQSGSQNMPKIGQNVTSGLVWKRGYEGNNMRLHSDKFGYGMLGVQTWEIKVSKMGYPYVSLFDRIFHEINHPVIWDPPFMEAPISWDHWKWFILHIGYPRLVLENTVRAVFSIATTIFITCPLLIKHGNGKSPSIDDFPLEAPCLKDFPLPHLITRGCQWIHIELYFIISYDAVWFCMGRFGSTPAGGHRPPLGIEISPGELTDSGQCTFTGSLSGLVPRLFASAEGDQDMAECRVYYWVCPK